MRRIRNRDRFRYLLKEWVQNDGSEILRGVWYPDNSNKWALYSEVSGKVEKAIKIKLKDISNYVVLKQNVDAISAGKTYKLTGYYKKDKDENYFKFKLAGQTIEVGDGVRKNRWTSFSETMALPSIIPDKTFSIELIKTKTGNRNYYLDELKLEELS